MDSKSRWPQIASPLGVLLALWIFAASWGPSRGVDEVPCSVFEQYW